MAERNLFNKEMISNARIKRTTQAKMSVASDKMQRL
jgi:hypothetical protein